MNDEREAARELANEIIEETKGHMEPRLAAIFPGLHEVPDSDSTRSLEHGALRLAKEIAALSADLAKAKRERLDEMEHEIVALRRSLERERKRSSDLSVEVFRHGKACNAMDLALRSAIKELTDENDFAELALRAVDVAEELERTRIAAVDSLVDGSGAAKLVEVFELASKIGEHWRDQEGVNGLFIDRLAVITAPEVA